MPNLDQKGCTIKMCRRKIQLRNTKKPELMYTKKLSIQNSLITTNNWKILRFEFPSDSYILAVKRLL